MREKLKVHDGDTPGKVFEIKLEYPKQKEEEMSDMKCPFCQQELRKIHPTYVICDNCRITGEDKLWQELIRTRKALDDAVDAIDVISLKYHKDTPSIFLIKYAQNAKDQITALEQKDK